MRFRAFALLLAMAALPGALAAEPWDKVDELPGGIAIELDRDSVFETLDGAREVWRGVFRRENAAWTMESHVAVDCELERAKLRGIRLLDGAEVLTERIDHLAEFAPINAGSAEAIYYKALCGRPPAIELDLPEAVAEDTGIDLPPGMEPDFDAQFADPSAGDDAVTIEEATRTLDLPPAAPPGELAVVEREVELALESLPEPKPKPAAKPQPEPELDPAAPSAFDALFKALLEEFAADDPPAEGAQQ